MNSEDKLIPTNISEIIEKTNDTLRKFAIKETEWLMQKGVYENKIAELEGHLKAHKNINIDLIKRVKMLEYALSQERQKNSKNEVNKVDYKAAIEVEDKRELLSEEDLRLIREKSVRPSLIS